MPVSSSSPPGRRPPPSPPSLRHRGGRRDPAARRGAGASAAPAGPPGASLLLTLPRDLIIEALECLGAADLPSVELSCAALLGAVSAGGSWRSAYQRQVRREEWRMPPNPPRDWKRYYHQTRKERGLLVAAKIPQSSARVVWRVALPRSTEPFRRRSREFAFSVDALGQPIRWQLEVDLAQATPAGGSSSSSAGALSTVLTTTDGSDALHHQRGLVRMWTTNQWTSDATRHYYGSHCTASLRDPLGVTDVVEEQGVDIDNSNALEFDAARLPPNRELVVVVHLTLALERAAPLRPFYERIAAEDTGESAAVRVGYCKAVFEVARCKRKHGGTFVRPCDRDVGGLVRLAAAPGTDDGLRVEVFQALFNLLGPTAVLLGDEAVAGLLAACFRALARVPVPAPEDPSGSAAATLLAQNALGAVFNLLVHPHSAVIGGDEANLRCVAALLRDQAYTQCHFSVITVLLTVHARGTLPPRMLPTLVRDCERFIEAANPVDSECTGVAWDESDVAAFFVPLLRSRELLCVRFASWCIAQYYYPATAAEMRARGRHDDPLQSPATTA